MQVIACILAAAVMQVNTCNWGNVIITIQSPMAISDEQILQAALSVISERGYTAATTKLIAAQAGINEVTLFRRFGNKQTLMRRMIQNEADRLGRTELQYTGDLEADLTQIVTLYQKIIQKRGHVMLMMMSEVPKQPELLEVLQTPREHAGEAANIIARYQQEGKLIDEPIMTAFGSLIGPLFLSGVMGSLEPALALMSLEPEEVVKYYLHGRRVKS